MSKKEYVSPLIITVELAAEQSLMAGSELLRVKNTEDYDYTLFDEDVKGNLDADNTLWID